VSGGLRAWSPRADWLTARLLARPAALPAGRPPARPPACRLARRCCSFPALSPASSEKSYNAHAGGAGSSAAGAHVSAGVLNLRFAPAGSHLVSVGADRCVMQWRHVPAAAEAIVGTLNPAEPWADDPELAADGAIGLKPDPTGEDFRGVKPWVGSVVPPTMPPADNALAPEVRPDRYTRLGLCRACGRPAGRPCGRAAVRACARPCMRVRARACVCIRACACCRVLTAQRSACAWRAALRSARGAPARSQARLELEFVHGVRLGDVRGGVRYNANGEIVFVTGRLAVAYNPTLHSQRFFVKHANPRSGTTPNGLMDASQFNAQAWADEGLGTSKPRPAAGRPGEAAGGKAAGGKAGAPTRGRAAVAAQAAAAAAAEGSSLLGAAAPSTDVASLAVSPGAGGGARGRARGRARLGLMRAGSRLLCVCVCVRARACVRRAGGRRAVHGDR
jgi:hypothetical protein